MTEREKNHKNSISVLGPTGTPVMWAIIFAILLCTQYYISGGNRPKNAKLKFHAQNKSVFPTEKISRPINWAETLGNKNSTTNTYEIKFTSHSSDHSSQEANPTNSFCRERIEISTKTEKNASASQQTSI